MVKYNEDLWIGMNDINWDMHFVWTDGKGISYTNWAKGQPSLGPSGRYSDMEVVLLYMFVAYRRIVIKLIIDTSIIKPHICFSPW